MSQLVEEAVEALERRMFFESFTDRYESLRADTDAWREIEGERAIEAGVLRDRSS
jgi:hypothetical protein